MKKLFTIFYLMFISMLITAEVYGRNSFSESKIPEVNYRNGIYEITIDAPTPYGRGIQHGKALKTQINQGILAFKNWITSNTSITDVDTFVKQFLDQKGYAGYTKDHTPDLYEELKGISDGANVSFEMLFAYQAFDELFVYFALNGFIELQGHCTTVGIVGTADAPNFVTHNNDIPPYFKGLNTLLRIKDPNSDLIILQGTFAGVIAQNGVNNKGIAVGINTLGNVTSNSNGLPVAFNVRKILEQSSVKDALAFLETVQCAQPMNYMIGDQHQVVSVEVYGKGKYSIIPLTSNYIVHTNHTQSDETPLAFEMNEESGGGSFANTLGRLTKANNWLHDNAKTINEKSLMELKSSDQINVFPGTSSGRTLQSMVVVISKTETPYVYYTADSPSISKYTKFEF
ncbi:hypothetical protein MY04_2521 [Flammeovirga sp. MY04]|uniref:C45 family autoproteolytic acyltransferase/hydolase n=1 Tax=Flammeovirga sp. MY04 TaxID=1191459 RepID=UPI0008063B8D|nr:C45 family peptidase [Flammeovirga sp. MY04]ANQ49890.1 hypothetical protein MY04_2521 [Flammeovirga sp. MY04]